MTCTLPQIYQNKKKLGRYFSSETFFFREKTRNPQLLGDGSADAARRRERAAAAEVRASRER